MGRKGLSRSGVAALDRGWPVDEAVALVRRRRSPWEPGNDAFTSYLSAGLDVAALLVGPDPLG
ncbi:MULTISPECIES: hypothetical protein [unclassified Streptomyces]|uniref:hypothetical protein n=1 Tax=unclassified Streptomyces TaxID=2593676 RepID=UPI00224EAF45|nr:hypothetical protein [Streptomyces sp. NBC_00320]